MKARTSATTEASLILIRCLPEEVVYEIEENKLRDGSKVFDDMLSSCDNLENTKTIDILESSCEFSLLIELLKHPPSPIDARSAGRQPMIPFPLLPKLFTMADKYIVSAQVMNGLQAHLNAHAETNPLQVYGLACQYGLHAVANNASRHLHTPPLESYSTKDIAIIPSAEDYHRLLLLQKLRKEKLELLLQEEDVFPHGYGECWTHSDYTRGRWNEARSSAMLSLDAGSDITQKMKDEARDLILSCPTCLKAWTAATDMLEYKCRKAIHKVSQVPSRPQPAAR